MELKVGCNTVLLVEVEAFRIHYMELKDFLSLIPRRYIVAIRNPLHGVESYEVVMESYPTKKCENPLHGVESRIPWCHSRDVRRSE